MAATKKLKKIKLDDTVLCTRDEARALALIGQLEGEHGEVRFADGHLTLDGDLVLDAPAPGLVVTGNLTVKGSVINRNGDSGPPLIVGGDLKAKNVVGGGAEIIVLGSATVSNAVYGHYNHGEIRIDGDLKARAWISADHSMWVSGRLQAPTAGLVDGDFRFADHPDAFHKGLVVDGRLDHGAMLERILAHKPPLRSGAKPARVIVLETLEKLADDGPIDTLDLRGKDLRAYPPILETLEMERLYLDVTRVPPSVGDLTSLRELYFDGWSRGESLPAELYGLEGLEVLHIPYTGHDAALPDGIGRLGSLRILGMKGHPTQVPGDLGALAALRELDVSGISAMTMTAFPTQILELDELEVLVCRDQHIGSLPDLSGLSRLHTLALSGTLGSLDEVPDLSRLPALRRLAWGGGRPTTSSPYPDGRMVEAVLGLEQLELSRWGIDRKAFDFPDDTFSGLPNLRALSLSINQLERLPASLFELEHLEALDLDLNRGLPASELDRVRERWPDIALGVALDLGVFGHERRAFAQLGEVGGGQASSQLRWMDVELPAGTRIEVRARGAKDWRTYHPWFAVGTLTPGRGALPIGELMAAKKQLGCDRYELRAHLLAARDGGATRFPRLGAFWIE